MLSNGDTSAGHAPNILYAAASGTISYLCYDGTSAAVRVGDFVYAHLVYNTQLYHGKSFNQGDVMGQMVKGSFSNICGSSDQFADWYHVHWGFANTGTILVESISLNMNDQLWHRSGGTWGPDSWIHAYGGALTLAIPDPTATPVPFATFTPTAPAIRAPTNVPTPTSTARATSKATATQTPFATPTATTQPPTPFATPTATAPLPTHTPTIIATATNVVFLTRMPTPLADNTPQPAQGPLIPPDTDTSERDGTPQPPRQYLPMIMNPAS